MGWARAAAGEAAVGSKSDRGASRAEYHTLFCHWCPGLVI